MPSIDFVQKHLPKAEPKVSTPKNGTITTTPKILGLSDFEKASICANDAATRGINLVEGYSEWWLSLASLASLGEPARELAHLVSSQSSKYNYEECDKKFNEALKNSSITGIDYFLKRCQEVGINYHTPSQKPSYQLTGPGEEIKKTRSTDQVLNRNGENVQNQEEDFEAKFKELLSHTFNDSNPIPKPVGVITIDGCVISTAGNLTVIGGASKVGKSGLVGAILAGAMIRKGDVITEEDLLGITTAPNNENKGLIHIDSEQSRYDHQRFNNQVLKRCNRANSPSYYYSFSLQKFLPTELIEATRIIFHKIAEKHQGIHLAVIDGIGDYVSSVLDEEENNSVIRFFIQQATDFNIPIILVLHFNPNSDKGRGHLGSHLEHKSESYLSIEKEKDSNISKLHGKLLRNSGLFNEIEFEFNTEKGFHTMIAKVDKGAVAAEKISKRNSERIEYYSKVLSGIYENNEKLKYTELVDAISENFAIKTSGAKKKIKDLVDLGLINHDGLFYLFNKGSTGVLV